MRARPCTWAERAAHVVALGEIATGAALVAQPAAIAKLLADGLAAEADPYLRWIGVFVVAVGAAYLTPGLTADGPERWSRLRGAIEWTAIARLLVAAFVVAAVGANTLAPGWIAVAGYDAALAVLQVALLARGAFGRAG